MSENSVGRSTILAAARRIAERDGILDMSLTAVAAEAGVAPSSIYADFGSKTDLLLAVVAQDLATLARAMRGAFGDPELPAAVASSAPNKLPVAGKKEVVAGEPEAGPLSGAAAEAIARLQDSVATLEQRPVDAWLERRLREFERGLAAIEGRQTEKNAAEQNIEERFRRLGQNVELLEQRLRATADETARRVGQSLDASEYRLRQLLTETQDSAAALDRRLTIVENAALAPKPELLPLAPAASNDFEEAEAIPTPAESASAEPIVPPAAATPYLDVARRSAQAAAQTEITRARKKSRRKSETMIYLSMGSLFLFVAMLTAMGLLLRNQAMNERPATAAASSPVRVQIARHSAPSAASHPEVRLAALAQAGNPDAELLIGLNDLKAGQRGNPATAFSWLSRAAAHKQPLAEYQLGLMYQNGRGIRADKVQAFHWFESAALDGNRRAMHSLATCFVEGWGTEKNLAEAAQWFARAAALGLVNDQFNLGVLYERGMGVPQSLVDAYKWYAIAAAQGDTESAARIAALAPTLSSDDLAAARAAAASFKPEPIVAAANEAPDPARLR